MIAEIGLAIALYQLWRQCRVPSTPAELAAESPDDNKPAGTSDTAAGIVDLYGPSRAKYRVTSFARGAEQHFHIARRASNRDWISFLTDSRTGERIFWGANSSKQRGMDILRKDFQV